MKNPFDTLVSTFLSSTDKLIDVLEQLGCQAKLEDGYSKMLLYAYQLLLNDILPASNNLIHKKHMISFAILARSVLDITAQIIWIDKLSPEQRNIAIETFLNFNGAENIDEKPARVYDWYKMPDVASFSVSAKQRGIDIGIDREEYYIGDNNSFKVTIFDYLSKVLHFNPYMVQNLVGFDSNGKISYLPEYYRMQAIAACFAIDCFSLFTTAFIEHFHKNSPALNDAKNKILETHKSFHVWFHEQFSVDTKPHK